MSSDQMNAFLEKIKADPALQAKLKDASAQAVADVAGSVGISLSAADIQDASSSLSDAELEAVAGGGGNNCQGLSCLLFSNIG